MAARAHREPNGFFQLLDGAAKPFDDHGLELILIRPAFRRIYSVSGLRQWDMVARDSSVPAFGRDELHQDALVTWFRPAVEAEIRANWRVLEYRAGTPHVQSRAAITPFFDKSKLRLQFREKFELIRFSHTHHPQTSRADTALGFSRSRLRDRGFLPGPRGLLPSPMTLLPPLPARPLA